MIFCHVLATARLMLMHSALIVNDEDEQNNSKQLETRITALLQRSPLF